MLSKLSKITASEFLKNVNPNLFTPNPELFLLSKIFPDGGENDVTIILALRTDHGYWRKT